MKYTVVVTRKETATLEVEADNEIDAQAMAYLETMFGADWEAGEHFETMTVTRSE
jgi:hypothetical protein